MKVSVHFTLLAVLFTACLFPMVAQARTYDVLTANVPFKFNVGSRTFSPGRYQFIFVGNGLLALRDAKEHAVAMLMTRVVDNGKPVSETKLVFKVKNKKQPQNLSHIYLEKSSQVLEILGEEVAMQQAAPPALLPPAAQSIFDRRTAPGFKY
ncbi:MAG TPA: hypothetical protein VFB79_01625 [Candidatus Angelobacter sp.]|nr:hypothetical protein [Candidatus Angelobacter sp.]